MHNRRLLFIIGFLLFCSLYAFNAISAFAGTTRTMTACTQAAFNTAYAAAVSGAGDTIAFPAGSCTITWSGTSTIDKHNLTIQGEGATNTTIKTGSGSTVFKVLANNVRITALTLDMNRKNTTNQGMIMVGNNNGSGCSRTLLAKDFRIDNNSFINGYPNPNTEVLGWPSIIARGFVYGLIDHNSFTNCNGECIDIASNGTAGDPTHPASWERSLEYGQYTNGTVFIEDNTFTYSVSGSIIDNILDGNDGGRTVFRYNTVTIGAGVNIAGMLSGHELYYAGDVCDSGTNGGVGTLSMEAYENKIYVNNSKGLDTFVHQRSGRALIYNNTFYNNDTNDSEIARLTNRRSQHDNGDIANPRGYSGYCHEAQASYAVEGMQFSKTTLNSALGDDTGCPTMASVVGFPTYGGSIIVGTEQIDYTAISGNALTPCTRGANHSTRATHTNGSAVNLLVFGVCLEQPNNTWVWGNKTVGNADKNGIAVKGYDLYGYDPQSKDYTNYDIASYSSRPNNYQYRNDGSPFAYIPYPYPHPLALSTLPPPKNLRIEPAP